MTTPSGKVCVCPICGKPDDSLGAYKQLCTECAVKPEQVKATLVRILEGVGMVEKDDRRFIGAYLEGIHDNAQELLDALEDVERELRSHECRYCSEWLLETHEGVANDPLSGYWWHIECARKQPPPRAIYP